MCPRLDGVRVLKKETTQLMTLNHVPVACNKRNVFVFDKPGLGFSCDGPSSFGGILTFGARQL